MKRQIARSPVSTVKTLAAGTLLSTKRAPRRNARVAAEVVAAAMAADAAVIAADAAVAVVEIEAAIAEIAATAGSALLSSLFVPAFGASGPSRARPKVKYHQPKTRQVVGVPGPQSPGLELQPQIFTACGISAGYGPSLRVLSGRNDRQGASPQSGPSRQASGF